MSNVIEVKTLGGLNRIIDATDKLVVKYTSPSTCLPCRRLRPHYEAASKAREDYVFISVNMDEADGDLLRAVGITSVPTVYEYQHGSYFKEIKGRTAMAIIKELS